MDPRLVFGLFQDPEDKSEEKVKEIIDFSEHPYVLMGMFTRIIFRGDVVSNQIVKFFAEINKEMDVENLQILNKNMIFSRAYSYLSRLDLNNSFHIETLLDKASNPFLQACDLSIEHFTESEEYEKCSLIKKFKDFIEFSQNKLPL
jgi:hypothetical protein